MGIAENIGDQKEEQNKIKESGIAKAIKEQTGKENDVVETVQVLLRLKRLATDELQSIYGTQRNGTVGKYNIVNNYNVTAPSFIQRSNIRQELRAIMEKTSTSGKALISSLILMVTAQDVGNFANQAQVKKIIEVLDRLIVKNNGKKP